MTYEIADIVKLRVSERECVKKDFRPRRLRKGVVTEIWEDGGVVVISDGQILTFTPALPLAICDYGRKKYELLGKWEE